jgi:hypothetical protein
MARGDAQHERMKFKAGDLEFNATVAEASEVPSPRTGHMLQSLTIQFRAQKAAMHEHALEEARRRQTGGVFSLSDADQPALEWRVRESTSSYVGTEPWGINHHVWRIDQVERQTCERLEVGGIALEPYEYAESVDEHGAVRLAARALAREDDLDALSRMSSAVEVVRVGVSDTPRRMTVSYVWGPSAQGPGVAVRCEDAREPRITLDNASGGGDPLVDLVAVLVASGNLAESEVAEFHRRRHAARRVANLDAWSLAE